MSAASGREDTGAIMAGPAGVQRQYRNPPRVLAVTGLDALGFEDNSFTNATKNALKSAGMAVDEVRYPGKNDQGPLAAQLASGRYNACLILGLGSGDDFKPKTPTYPFKSGPWQDALVAFVNGGGVLFIHGERAAAAVLQHWFGKSSWAMQGDFYRRTFHQLNASCPLLAGYSTTMPPQLDVKACMLSGVPPEECVYSTGSGATTWSLVPEMSGVPVKTGMCAVAAGHFGTGIVGFFGDVNFESEGLQAVAKMLLNLAQGA